MIKRIASRSLLRPEKQGFFLKVLLLSSRNLVRVPGRPATRDTRVQHGVLRRIETTTPFLGVGCTVVLPSCPGVVPPLSWTQSTSTLMDTGNGESQESCSVSPHKPGYNLSLLTTNSTTYCRGSTPKGGTVRGCGETDPVWGPCLPAPRWLTRERMDLHSEVRDGRDKVGRPGGQPVRKAPLQPVKHVEELDDLQMAHASVVGLTREFGRSGVGLREGAGAEARDDPVWDHSPPGRLPLLPGLGGCLRAPDWPTRP